MPGTIEPSFHGLILSSRDALLLFSAALDGHIPMITRRPHDKERSAAIVSGNIFIYCENTSNIKRWTDGVTWSPSRIMGNFLIYRELNKGFPPGEKKRATKRRTTTGRECEENELPPVDLTREQERIYVGSLIESYDFKNDGLVKKTISIKADDQTYHMVSYYSLRDAASHSLQQPSTCHQFMGMAIRQELVSGQQFRVAVDAHGNDLANNGSPSPRDSVSISPRGSVSVMAAPLDHLSPSSDDQEDGGMIHSHAPLRTPFQTAFSDPSFLMTHRYSTGSRDTAYETSSRTFGGYTPQIAAGGPSHELDRLNHMVPRCSAVGPTNTLPPIDFGPFERRIHSYDNSPHPTFHDGRRSQSAGGPQAQGHNLDDSLSHHRGSYSSSSYAGVSEPSNYFSNAVDHRLAYPRGHLSHTNDANDTVHPAASAYPAPEEVLQYSDDPTSGWS